MSGMKSSSSHLKAESPCSHWRRITTDHEASKMWWMSTISSMPIAMAVQYVTPTRYEVATLAAPETKIPTAVSASPAMPTMSAVPAAGAEFSAGSAVAEAVVA